MTPWKADSTGFHADAQPAPSQTGTPRAKMDDLLVDTTWRLCVGQCLGQDCGRLFISRERYDEHIAPLIAQLSQAKRDAERYRARRDAEYYLLMKQLTKGHTTPREPHHLSYDAHSDYLLKGAALAKREGEEEK